MKNASGTHQKRSAQKKYGSLADLMQGEEIPQEIQNKVHELEDETRVVDHLARMRHAAGLTQAEMASALGLSQSAISKLEGGLDRDLTIQEIQGYARVTRQRVGLTFGKPMTRVESVKHHAFAIRNDLTCLAQLANRHDELENDIKGFFGEAFFKILSILAECSERLPAGGQGVSVGIEITGDGEDMPYPSTAAV